LGKKKTTGRRKKRRISKTNYWKSGGRVESMSSEEDRNKKNQ